MPQKLVLTLYVTKSSHASQKAIRNLHASLRKFEAAKVSSALTLLDRVKCPALIIDWDGAVRNLNRLAESILEKDLHLRRGRLIGCDPASNRRLQQLVAAILAAAPCEPPALSQVVIHRADAPWLLIDVMPLTALGSNTFNGGRAVLILTDLTKPSVSDSKLLAILFGLTPAEAKLAAAIASGIGIDAAAASLRIARATEKPTHGGLTQDQRPITSD